ncbi:MAG: AAA-associated domain-containing protein [Nitrososphaerota archaeon]|nr:AAA-associated domain-containing protein [Nitrososphaerota archaeon]
MVANRQAKTLVMPGKVRPGQVISLVEITGGMGPKLDIPRVADEMGADIDVLFPVIDAAQMLGLVRLERGDLSLTEDGHAFQKTLKQKVKTLKDRLAVIEPFRTAMELAAKKHRISASDVAEALQQRGVKWHYQPEVNESVIRELLIHWTIYAGLLTVGKAGEFHRAGTNHSKLE